MLIRDGDRWGKGRESEGSTARPDPDPDPEDRGDRGPPPEQWPEVLKPCPLAIAQQLVYYAIAVSTVELGSVTRTMSVAQFEAKKKSNFRSLPAHDLYWANLRVQLTSLLISPGPAGESRPRGERLKTLSECCGLKVGH